jgi:hypothetical protein
LGRFSGIGLTESLAPALFANQQETLLPNLSGQQCIKSASTDCLYRINLSLILGSCYPLPDEFAPLWIASAVQGRMRAQARTSPQQPVIIMSP